MGAIGFTKCSTNYAPRDYPTYPPNPSPGRYKIMDIDQFANAYVLKVRYLDCTNYEGVKIMVYKGRYKERLWLDPHFAEGEDSPIARFKPDEEGMYLARQLAENL